MKSVFMYFSDFFFDFKMIEVWEEGIFYIILNSKNCEIVKGCRSFIQKMYFLYKSKVRQ